VVRVSLQYEVPQDPIARFLRLVPLAAVVAAVLALVLAKMAVAVAVDQERQRQINPEDKELPDKEIPVEMVLQVLQAAVAALVSLEQMQLQMLMGLQALGLLLPLLDHQ
jgi:phosphate/sulfate permease